MSNGNVGASILSIITESLYDKPIVVFREYVQNSVDSFQNIENEVDASELICKLWNNNNDLYLLDNGKGILKDRFFTEMISIGRSGKKRITNIGYKGIGRLSGLSYCEKLIFINICSYKNNLFQKYLIDGGKYNQVKAQTDFSELSFEELMNQIGTYTDTDKVSGSDIDYIQSILNSSQNIFNKQDTGFLVILENINSILLRTIKREGGKKKIDDFITELGWLLPVRFKEELLKTDQESLFRDMTEIAETSVIPAKAYNIYFNDIQIERPIRTKMLRDYTCKTNFSDYAVSFHSFYRDKISVDKDNDFTGIKLYLDNILLCDETELLPTLQKYGLIGHSSNELVQTVKGIGAMIYITDKINISANARRTFIEVTDTQSMEFLKLLAEFVNKIYYARYALSNYSSGKKNLAISKDKLDQLRKAANDALQELASDKITIEVEEPLNFAELNNNDKKRFVRKKLISYMNQKIKEYLLQTSTFDYENAIFDFQTWLSSNI